MTPKKARVEFMAYILGRFRLPHTKPQNKTALSTQRHAEEKMCSLWSGLFLRDKNSS